MLVSWPSGCCRRKCRQSVRPAGSSGQGEASWEARHLLLFPRAPTAPLGLTQHGTQWTTGPKQWLVKWSTPPGGVQLELVWLRHHPLPHSGSAGKESACNTGDPGSIPGSGRSLGEGNGYPFQFSCLENSMDRGGWRARVRGVPKSRKRLSD